MDVLHSSSPQKTATDIVSPDTVLSPFSISSAIKFLYGLETSLGAPQINGVQDGVSEPMEGEQEEERGYTGSLPVFG